MDFTSSTSVTGRNKMWFFLTKPLVYFIYHSNVVIKTVLHSPSYVFIFSQIHCEWPYRPRIWKQASAAHCSSPAPWRDPQNTPSPGTGTQNPSCLTSTSPSRDNTTTRCRSPRLRSSTPEPTSALPPEKATQLRTFPLFCWRVRRHSEVHGRCFMTSLSPWSLNYKVLQYNTLYLNISVLKSSCKSFG